MQTEATTSATPSPLGRLLEAERRRGGVDVPADLSIRALAKRAGVSAAQLSRIENGLVAKPSPEILAALARALNRNPLPLLVLAGHIDGRQAQGELRSLFFREGAELPEEWGDWARFSLEEVRDRLHSEAISPEDLAAIAADVFRVQETDETLWDDAYNLVMARGEDAAQLRELMGIWRTAHGQRERILEYARLMRTIADLEYVAEAEAERHTPQTDRTRRSARDGEPKR